MEFALKGHIARLDDIQNNVRDTDSIRKESITGDGAVAAGMTGYVKPPSDTHGLQLTKGPSMLLDDEHPMPAGRQLECQDPHPSRTQLAPEKPGSRSRTKSIRDVVDVNDPKSHTIPPISRSPKQQPDGLGSGCMYSEQSCDDEAPHPPGATAGGASSRPAAASQCSIHPETSKLKPILKTATDLLGSTQRSIVPTTLGPAQTVQSLSGRGALELSPRGIAACPPLLLPERATTVEFPAPQKAHPEKFERRSSTVHPPSNISKTHPEDSSQQSQLEGPDSSSQLNTDDLVGRHYSKTKYPPSIVDHHTVTPPPDISTSPGGRGYNPKVKLALTLSKVSPGLVRPSSIISAAAPSPAEVTTENASADHSHISPSAASSVATVMRDFDKRRASSSAAEDMDKTDVNAEAHTSVSFSTTPAAADTGPSTPLSVQDTVESTESSSKLANSVADSLSRRHWSKLKPLSARDAILYPLVSIALPVPGEDAPLFLPADAERMWYMGYVNTWKDFNAEVITFWKSKETIDAFKDIGGQPMCPPRTTDADITSDSHGFEKLSSWFQRDVVELVNDIANRLLSSAPYGVGIQGMLLGDAVEEDIGNDECPWSPDYVIKAVLPDGELETRMLGQVEYLGGKMGALTWAIDECARNTWGSLRCVLGDIAHFMLISSTRYAFLLSVDEIIFLKCEMQQKCEYPEGDDPVALYVEPWLVYSPPIRFTDVLDEEKGTIPAKLALLYLLHLTMQKGWQVNEDIGNSLNYFAKTKAGEKYFPKLDFVGPDGKLKLLGKY